MATIKDMLFAGKSGGGGITPTGTLNITENGTYNVTNYASAEVDVPSSGGLFNVVVTGKNTRTPEGYPIEPVMLSFYGVGLKAGNRRVAYIENVPGIRGDGESVQTVGGFFLNGYTVSDITGADFVWAVNVMPTDEEPYYEFDHVDTSTNTVYLNLCMTYS